MIIIATMISRERAQAIARSEGTGRRPTVGRAQLTTAAEQRHALCAAGRAAPTNKWLEGHNRPAESLFVSSIASRREYYHCFHCFAGPNWACSYLVIASHSPVSALVGGRRHREFKICD